MGLLKTFSFLKCNFTSVFSKELKELKRCKGWEELTFSNTHFTVGVYKEQNKSYKDLLGMLP